MPCRFAAEPHYASCQHQTLSGGFVVTDIFAAHTTVDYRRETTGFVVDLRVDGETLRLVMGKEAARSRGEAGRFATAEIVTASGHRFWGILVMPNREVDRPDNPTTTRVWEIGVIAPVGSKTYHLLMQNDSVFGNWEALMQRKDPSFLWRPYAYRVLCALNATDPIQGWSTTWEAMQKLLHRD